MEPVWYALENDLGLTRLKKDTRDVIPIDLKTNQIQFPAGIIPIKMFSVAGLL
jgi:hypothetical protein